MLPHVCTRWPVGRAASRERTFASGRSWPAPPVPSARSDSSEADLCNRPVLAMSCLEAVRPIVTLPIQRRHRLGRIGHPEADARSVEHRLTGFGAGADVPTAIYAALYQPEQPPTREPADDPNPKSTTARGSPSQVGGFRFRSRWHHLPGAGACHLASVAPC